MKYMLLIYTSDWDALPPSQQQGIMGIMRGGWHGAGPSYLLLDLSRGLRAGLGRQSVADDRGLQRHDALA